MDVDGFESIIFIIKCEQIENRSNATFEKSHIFVISEIKYN